MKRNCFLSVLATITVLVGLSLSPALVGASPILDFDMAAPTAGTISYAGGSNPLVGSGISVDTIVGLTTPSNDGVVVNLIGGTLNFTSGAFTSFDPLHWNFAGGGTITLTGGADLNGNGFIDPGEPSGTLFTGSFTSANVFIDTTVGNVFKIAGAAFVDTKDPTLANFYGLPGGPSVNWAGNFNLSMLAGRVPPQSFTSTRLLSGDIINTAPAVPEPATMFLLGSGLVGLATFARKKFKK